MIFVKKFCTKNKKVYLCDMENFECIIDSVIYHSEDQGFAILNVSYGKPVQKTTILINMPEVNLGVTLNVEGEWVNNKKYGRQFKVEKWEEILPTTERGIERYLSSGLIKGVGLATARELVKLFGVNALDIIDKHSDEIFRIKGLGQKRAQMIWASWDRQRGIRDVMVFLKTYDIGTGIGVKIYKKYGDDSIEQLKTNPYKLIYDVDGIGFLTADEIARKLGFAPDDPLRISSAIEYVLDTFCDEGGDTYLEEKLLIGKTVTLLQLSPDLIHNAIYNMIEEGDLIEEGSDVFLPKLYHCEINIAEALYAKATQESPFYIDESIVDIEKLEMYTGIEYEEEQKEAIKKAVTSNVIVITGGPGTGKTTLTHGVVTALHSLGMSILLAAPTGKAADKLSDATDMEAQTIHRLLGAHPGGIYDHDENNPLRGDVLVVDEISMVNVYLMNSLIKAVPPHMRLVLIGDVDQLPCIGPGNVLRNIIESGVIPVIRLTKIFRQAQGSMIITNAHAINRGEEPIFKNTRDSDFFFIKTDDENEIPNTIVDLVCNRLPSTYNVEPKEIQVLTPMKKNAVGTINLNKMLQEKINPYGDEIVRGDVIFRVGDKVIQTKNNYDKAVFNGDSGYIISVDASEKTLNVDFGEQIVFYDQTDMEELMHAYALTIHKSQGSEYPIVVMPVTNAHYFMLSKNLLYTGITRARRICVLVGSKDALLYGIKNIRVARRNTKLKERLLEQKEYE